LVVPFYDNARSIAGETRSRTRGDVGYKMNAPRATVAFNGRRRGRADLL